MTSPTTPVVRLWTGRVITAILVLFLVFDSVTELMMVKPVKDGMAQLGYPSDLGPTIGTILLVCLALYLIPRTAVLGAVLLTGYLGGAVTSNLRVGNPLFSHTLFPSTSVCWSGSDSICAMVDCGRS